MTFIMKKILLTGGTGFFGKSILDMVLILAPFIYFYALLSLPLSLSYTHMHAYIYIHNGIYLEAI